MVSASNQEPMGDRSRVPDKLLHRVAVSCADSLLLVGWQASIVSVKQLLDVKALDSTGECSVDRDCQK